MVILAGFSAFETVLQTWNPPKGQIRTFQTVWRPEEMPGRTAAYTPGRIGRPALDEAMNDLAILATGCTLKDLPGQNGAPVRVVVPWKYGFKSNKSIIKLELAPDMPRHLLEHDCFARIRFLTPTSTRTLPQTPALVAIQRTGAYGEAGRGRETFVVQRGYADQSLTCTKAWI